MDFTKLFSLEGKIALITGGSRGIGKMLLEGYLAAGCERVYITARKKAQLDETVAEFEAQYPGKVIGLAGDLSQSDGIAQLVAELSARETRLDVLVNNAGAAWGGDFETFPEVGWDKVMDLNVKSLFFLTQKLFPLLKAAGSFDRPAKVINVASIDGLRPQPMGHLFVPGLEGGADPSDQADGGAADQGPDRGDLHRPGCLSERDEQGRREEPRRQRQGHPLQADRRGRRHRRGRDLPRQPGGRLCRRHHDPDRRRDRQRVDPRGVQRSVGALTWQIPLPS